MEKIEKINVSSKEGFYMQIARQQKIHNSFYNKKKHCLKYCQLLGKRCKNRTCIAFNVTYKRFLFYKGQIIKKSTDSNLLVEKIIWNIFLYKFIIISQGRIMNQSQKNFKSSTMIMEYSAISIIMGYH